MSAEPSHTGAQLVLVNGRFVAELSSAQPGDNALWIQDGDIAAIGTDDDILAEARTRGEIRVLDLGGAWMLPGLIDMHTHFGVVHTGTSDDARLGGETEAATALRMAACARQALLAGVTTVRLVSERHPTDHALRGAVERGETPGPRIFTAGQALTSTAGHGLGSHAVEADGPDDFRRRAREQIKRGADLIKVMVSGGVSDEHEGLNSPLMTVEEVRAAVDVAHAWGKPIAGHLGGPDVIELALDCGVDSVEHGYGLSEEIAARMGRSGTWFVPTALVTRSREYFERIDAPAWLPDRLESAAARHAEAIRHAVRHGVPILVGTDFLPAERFDETTAMVREMEVLVEEGVPSVDVLRGATTLAAQCLGWNGRIGYLAPGHLADVIAVDADPAGDMSRLRDLHWVIKAGQVIRSRTRPVLTDAVAD